jgi:hypothetical protein
MEGSGCGENDNPGKAASAEFTYEQKLRQRYPELFPKPAAPKNPHNWGAAITPANLSEKIVYRIQKSQKLTVL